MPSARVSTGDRAAVVAHVIGGEAGQAVAAQPVGARVADMQHVREPAAQHQRGKGAAHADKVRILPALGIDPGVERIEDARAGAAHLHGLRHVPEAVEEAAHRGFRRLAPALGAADAVGDRRRHVAPLRGEARAEHGADEILVARARSGRRVKPMLARGDGRVVAHPSTAPLLARRTAPDHGGSRQMIVQEIAAGAGRHDDRQLAGTAVERVVAAILGVVPGDFGRR